MRQLHIGYEQVVPFALQRHDAPDVKARAAGLAPKPLLRGVPPEARDYRLGNRCAIDWVLDQHKKKKPRDATIRERFDTDRLADDKERVIDLLARVTTVSVRTQAVVAGMRALPPGARG